MSAIQLDKIKKLTLDEVSVPSWRMITDTNFWLTQSNFLQYKGTEDANSPEKWLELTISDFTLDCEIDDDDSSTYTPGTNYMDSLFEFLDDVASATISKTEITNCKLFAS